MTVKRRTFLLGTVSGLSVLALSACTGEEPVPTPTPTLPPPDTTVPAPTAFQRSSWSADPLSRGAFSFPRVGSTPQQRDALRQPIDGRVFFAGEHTSDANPGTVQGARSSGHRVATEVAETAQAGERIAIIGAGIAGATAARRLADAGFSVVVVEGRERAGGRIHTVQDDDWTTPIELGAAWVRDSSRNSLVSDLGRLGVDTVPFDYDTEYRSMAGETLEPTTIGPQAVTEAIEWAAGQPADVSVADALVESGAADVDSSPADDGVSEVDRLASYVESSVVIATGADTDDLSAWYADDPTIGHEDDRLVAGGYEELVAADLEGLDLLTASVVSSVVQSDRGVSLRLARGESLSADRVVITVPLGVLQANSIEFDPPLPFSHRGAINALGMGHQEKLVLQFEKPFWSTDATVWNVVDGEPTFPLWFNVEPSTGEAVLVALIGGEDAVAMAELSDDDVIAAARASLEPFVNADLLDEE